MRQQGRAFVEQGKVGTGDSEGEKIGFSAVIRFDDGQTWASPGLTLRPLD